MAKRPIRTNRELPPIEYRTEAALCAAFIRWVETNSEWVAYCETGGWDILLANPAGEQFGIQAKLKSNLKVITQAMTKDGWHREGPDYRGVLLAERPKNREFEDICGCLGLHVFWPQNYGRNFGDQLDTFAPDISKMELEHHNPEVRHELPDYVPDVAAGASSPVQLTPWKVGALKIMARLEIRGFVTRQDFRDIGIDYRRWTQNTNWLRRESDGRFVRGDQLAFDKQHPRVYAKIVEETRVVLADTQKPTT